MLTTQILASNTSQSTSSTPSPRLIKAAEEFEGQLMKELLKPLSSSNSLLGSEEDDGSANALNEFASESLGQAMSRAGGLGIAHQIVQKLSHAGNQSVTSSVPRN